MVAWETMSVLSYLLVSYGHRRTESAQAGFLMLAMSEAGAIAVVLAFAILVNAAGRLDFPALRASPRPSPVAAASRSFFCRSSVLP